MSMDSLIIPIFAVIIVTAMDFLTLTKSRYSVRSYTARPVEKEKLEYILECARMAPSATNAQPWKLFVVTDEEVKAKIYKSYTREWIANVPVYIVVCVDSKGAWVRNNFDKKNHADIDGAIITEHICLAATECGLGTCWVCNFDPELCAEALQLPTGLIPLALIPLGYPATDEIPEKKRKELSEIVIFR